MAHEETVVNEMKQVWKDVADILEKEGWFAGNESERSALGASEQAPVLLSLPSTKEPSYYRWLPAGVVTALVICFLATFLMVGSQQQKPKEQNLTTLREQMEKVQQQLKAQEDLLHAFQKEMREQIATLNKQLKDR